MCSKFREFVKLAAIMLLLSAGFTASSVQAKSAAQQANEFPVGLRVTPLGLNFRAGPGIGYRSLDVLRRGECVTATDKSNGWYHVVQKDGSEGWSYGQYLVADEACSLTADTVAADESAAQPTEENQQATTNADVASVASQPFVPNSRTLGQAYIHECFGTGPDNELREVSAETPVQVLGVADFSPPEGQRDELGTGQFAKIRLWDGQYAFAPISAVDTSGIDTQPVSNVCEASDRIDFDNPPGSAPMATPPSATETPVQPTATSTPVVEDTETPVQPTATPAPTTQNCDPSYPDVCIPSPPPDLSCDDIPYLNFAVIGSDPHRFDGDNDGVGCES